MATWAYQQAERRVRNYGPSVVLDVLIVALAFEAATLLRFVETSHLRQQMRELLVPNLFVGGIYAIISYLLGLHRRLWRYASLRDGFSLAQAVGIMMVLVAVLDVLGQKDVRLLPLGVIVGGGLLSFLFLGSVKIMPRLINSSSLPRDAGNRSRVLVVGAGQAGAAFVSRLMLNGKYGYQPVAFVDDDPGKWRRRIHDRPIIGPIDHIPPVVERYGVDVIAIALPTASRERISEIIAICQQTTASIKIVRGLQEVVGDTRDPLYLREVNIADLLGREVVPLQTHEARIALQGKTVLVTGGAGSIGSELCRQLVGYGPSRVIALDNNETGLFDLAESLRGDEHADRLRLRIGDITDGDDMEQLFSKERPNIIFHAAAYKHVPLLEQHPEQAVRTNVLGSYWMACLARQHGAECFVFVSSDKAADPINILGASKRAGEIVVQAMAQTADSPTIFCAVRFGNVIGSRGSVVPTFLKQIEAGGPVTVTNASVTRYFMTIPEACGLVIVTSTIAESGGLFLLDMGAPVKIADLAVKMIRLRGLRVDHDIPVIFTGLRPGEKMHEILAAPDERLLSTRQSKIFQVAYDGDVLTRATLDQWMRDLEQTLLRHDEKALRTRLFDIVKLKISV
ncbi:MAG: polysaccharide biosynthesis protein [Ktedonobacterales bacterium]|nr:polysaccharide biosynthesis protein [Ktedonobacterales bacterium]